MASGAAAAAAFSGAIARTPRVGVAVPTARGSRAVAQPSCPDVPARRVQATTDHEPRRRPVGTSACSVVAVVRPGAATTRAVASVRGVSPRRMRRRVSGPAARAVPVLATVARTAYARPPFAPAGSAATPEALSRGPEGDAVVCAVGVTAVWGLASAAGAARRAREPRPARAPAAWRWSTRGP